MSFFLPTVALKRVTDISEELLNSLGIRAVFLDVDNTLSTHGSQSPFEGSVAWAQNLVEQGFQLFIISNNFKERVEPFAALYHKHRVIAEPALSSRRVRDFSRALSPHH